MLALDTDLGIVNGFIDGYSAFHDITTYNGNFYNHYVCEGIDLSPAADVPEPACTLVVSLIGLTALPFLRRRRWFLETQSKRRASDSTLPECVISST
jgi:hypothetical protein